jgi:hypothetical protein
MYNTNMSYREQHRTELSSINKVNLVQVSSYSNTGSIRDDPYWTSRENSLELIELSSINKVSLVQVSSCSNTGQIRDGIKLVNSFNSYYLGISNLFKSLCSAAQFFKLHQSCDA